jgi:hypothetical protein
MMYMIAVVVPALVLLSGLSVFPHFANVIDLVGALVGLAFHLMFAITYGTESAGSLGMLYAPGFVVIPVYLWILVCVIAARRLVTRRPGFLIELTPGELPYSKSFSIPMSLDRTK